MLSYAMLCKARFFFACDTMPDSWPLYVEIWSMSRSLPEKSIQVRGNHHDRVYILKSALRILQQMEQLPSKLVHDNNPSQLQLDIISIHQQCDHRQAPGVTDQHGQGHSWRRIQSVHAKVDRTRK